MTKAKRRRTLRNYLWSLNPRERDVLAAKAGTKASNLVQIAHGNNQPSPGLALRLWRESGGAFEFLTANTSPQNRTVMAELAELACTPKPAEDGAEAANG